MPDALGLFALQISPALKWAELADLQLSLLDQLYQHNIQATVSDVLRLYQAQHVLIDRDRLSGKSSKRDVSATRACAAQRSRWTGWYARPMW